MSASDDEYEIVYNSDDDFDWNVMDTDNSSVNSSDEEHGNHDMLTLMDGGWNGVRELHPHACRERRMDFKIMSILLERDPYCINRPQERESLEIPLHAAIYCNHVQCVEFLIDEGADIELENTERQRPIEKALIGLNNASNLLFIEKFKEIIKILLDHGANANYQGTDHERTYYLKYIATSLRDDDTLKLFLDYGSDTEDWNAMHDDFNYESPLYCALKYMDVSASKILFMYGAIVPGSNRYPAHALSKPIPHIIHTIMDAAGLTKETMLRILAIYRNFGGNFNLRYRGYTVMELINTEQHIPADGEVPNSWEEYVKTMTEYSRNPLPLLAITRLKIHQSFQKRDHRACIKELGLPKLINRYLKFKEI